MYRCEITNKVSDPGEPLHKVVALTRERVYTRKIRNEETGKLEDVVIGKGFEPVLELNLSLEGETLWNSWSDDEKQIFLKDFRRVA